MKFTILLALVSAASAHVHMATPGALRASDNLVAKAGTIDDSINSPLNPDGSNFPCKGYHLDVAANKPGSESVADWAPGSTQKVTFGPGGAPHAGGSCQVSLSVDGGETFKVVRSFMGGCPAVADNNGEASLVPELPFTVPKDTPAGSAIFSWSWQNRVGNREMYMNCAHVTITSEGAGSEELAFDQRPDVFKANLGTVSDGCTTEEGTDVEYPEPGPDPVIAPSAKLGAAKGGPQCGRALSDSSPINAPVAPERGLEVRPSSAAPSTSTTSTPASVTAISPAAGLTLDATDLGRCGPVAGVSYTCDGSKHGASCSSFGYCGDTAEHTGPGCQAQFGKCPGAAGVVSSTKALSFDSSATSSPSSASSFLGAQPSSLQSSSSEATVAPSTIAANQTLGTSSTASAALSTLPSGNTGSAVAESTTSVLPVPTLPSSNTGSSVTESTTSVPVASGNSTTGLPIHPEGKCGALQDGEFTCEGSGHGCACSSAGWCGISPAHYGQGCQSAFGTCGKEAASCKGTVPSGVASNATATGIIQSGGPVAVTSVIRTTIPVLTVTVTESDAATSSAAATATAIPTTMITETRPAASSESKSSSTSLTTEAAATIVPRFKRPAGSFFDSLRNPKVVSAIGTKGLAKPTLGAVFGDRQ